MTDEKRDSDFQHPTQDRIDEIRKEFVENEGMLRMIDLAPENERAELRSMLEHLASQFAEPLARVEQRLMNPDVLEGLHEEIKLRGPNMTRPAPEEDATSG